MIAQIKQYVPLAAPLFDIQSSVREYSEQLSHFQTDPTYLERQKLVKDLIHQHARRIFGDTYREDLHLELDDQLMLNIIDHHQVLNAPSVLASNVIANSGKLLQDTKQNAIVVFSSGNVPLNNAFTKGGFKLHGKQVPLFSVSEFRNNSHLVPKREFDFVNRLHAQKRWAEFTEEEQQFLTTFQTVIDGLDFSRAAGYADQISIIVKNTWPLLFEESQRATLPELVFIPQEEILADILIEVLADENIMSECLFEPLFRSAMLESCAGIPGAWDESRQKGTHFFWFKHPEKHQMVRMYLQDGFLVPQEESLAGHRIPLERAVIIDLLRKREIYPNLFLIYSTLHFYAGIKPLTGYASMICITMLKGNWVKNLKNTRLAQEAELVEGMETSSGFVGGLPFFFKRVDGTVKTLFAADLFIDGGVHADYLRDVFEMRYGDFVSVGVPDMYDYYTQEYIPAEVQIKPTITFDEMAELVFGKMESL